MAEAAKGELNVPIQDLNFQSHQQNQTAPNKISDYVIKTGNRLFFTDCLMLHNQLQYNYDKLLTKMSQEHITVRCDLSL